MAAGSPDPVSPLVLCHLLLKSVTLAVVPLLLCGCDPPPELAPKCLICPGQAVSLWKVPKEEDLSIYYKMPYVTFCHGPQGAEDTARFRAPAGDPDTQSLGLKLSLCSASKQGAGDRR